jgi:hypothetical protein
MPQSKAEFFNERRVDAEIVAFHSVKQRQTQSEARVLKRVRVGTTEA